MNKLRLLKITTWMHVHAREYACCTTLAEACADALGMSPADGSAIDEVFFETAFTIREQQRLDA